ncbi:carbonic anhydrase 2-like [Haliotis rufescens]|uniref:carbonic anhydrase 2-like n=1 Tax=Haliotis rufescens TaxID=6454 RepID=UPI00201FA116|nr:carbonic anhydrase 2-like [Haliotis rufescens]XP_046356418.2 carbonic anhydrase 2-like [Haliotis rufescens]
MGVGRSWLCLAILFSSISDVFGSVGGWTYNGTLGPDHWHVDYPNCGGDRQSPINIETSKVEFNPILTIFDLSELAQTENINMTLANVNGHTVEVTISGSANMLVSGGGLEDKYGVKQFHFHWGQKDERGSEHDIDNKRFPMEMHIVLYSTKYADFDVAVDKPKGLAVLSFLFEVGETNANFQPLLSHFDKIQHSGNETSIPTFSTKSLLPANSAYYFRYEGSLTTPPCYESVVWSIFATRIVVSEQQMNQFRSIKRNKEPEGEENLVDDFRPLQKLNNRKLYTNSIDFTSGQSMVTVSHAIALLSVILSIAF